MRVMAHTMHGNMEELKVSSCPILIAPNVLTLLDREDSPLYLEDTIVMYDEENDIAEGDIVITESKDKGIIYYSKGWRIHWSSGQYNKFILSSHIYMTKRRRRVENSQSVRNIEEREEIRLVIEDEEFLFTSLMAKKDSLICVSGLPQLVNQNEIYLCTGLYDTQKAPLYFGQFYKGGIIGLDKEMRVVSKSINKIINLED